ncbi:hypothetical protein KFV02_08565 [Desulfohalobiaceae bacterium Ax17]|nr:hypothetical protein [Desulfovulcanus ferrireducens]
MDTKTLFKNSLLAILCVFLLALWLNPSMTYAQSPAANSNLINKARTVGVSEAVLNRVLSLGAAHQLSSADINLFLHALVSAQKEKIPLNHLMDKIEEGLAKRVPPRIIAQALQQEIDNYCYVQELLLGVISEPADKIISSEDFNVLVDSLNLGISRPELARFIELAPSASLPMLAIAVENLALLKQINFNLELAEQILFTGLRFKCFTPSWRYLARVIAAARERGISDQDIAKITLQTIRKKDDFKGLMNSLGFTGRNLRHGPTMGQPDNTQTPQ